MRIIITIILLFMAIGYTTNLKEDLHRFKNNKEYTITELENNILKIEHSRTGITKYINVENNVLSNLKKTNDVQVFDLPNTPDSLFEYRYTLKSRILIGQGLGYPLLFGDLNNNGKLNIAGYYKVIQDHEIAQAGIMELQEDSTFTLQYLYTYSDSSIHPLSVTDLDNDGLIELNIKRTQTFRNYEAVSPDSFPTDSVFDHRMWQMSGMVGSETFTYIDDDSLMDVVYVGDDTLDPWGNKFYVAEY
ncbi:MAG: hypothetical protein K8R79_09115, partial [Calditrichales bacterium]|nr:hypothetical protein [Calditrichales bacterium]